MKVATTYVNREKGTLTVSQKTLVDELVRTLLVISAQSVYDFSCR